MNWKPIIETLKELGRITLLGGIATGIAYYSNKPGELAVIITVMLRLVDKYLHQLGKSIDQRTNKAKILEKGLVRF